MIFEHFAINVTNIQDMVSWYVVHLGLKIVQVQQEPPFMTFLADASGRVVMELYHRADETILDFENQHPLTFHVAFVSENAESDKKRLLQAGASFIEEVIKEDGSRLVMLRDPWGMALQLCQRTKKF